MSGAPPRARPRWPWFAAWAGIGAGFAFGVLSILTIGIFVLPAVAALCVLVSSKPSSRRSWPGVVAGAGIAPLYVAWLNRGGPGDVCHTYAGGGECTSEWSPWPFVAVGAVLVVLGVSVFWARRTRDRRPAVP